MCTGLANELTPAHTHNIEPGHWISHRLLSARVHSKVSATESCEAGAVRFALSDRASKGFAEFVNSPVGD